MAPLACICVRYSIHSVSGRNVLPGQRRGPPIPDGAPPIVNDACHYFAGVTAGVTAAAFFVPLAFAVVDLACFAFVLLVVDVVVLAVAELVAGFGVGAGVACAANETPAIANVMVRPMIAETVFVIILSVSFGSA